jgi:hypothetical protein
MRILTVGIGALGGTIAARALRAGLPVRLAARNTESAEVLRRSGLRVSGIGGEGARGDCSTQRADAHYEYSHFEGSKMPAMRLKPTSCLKNLALSPPLPATGVTFDLFWRRHVLGIAVTKGPIFLRDFNKVDEDIFLANLYSFVEMVR